MCRRYPPVVNTKISEFSEIVMHAKVSLATFRDRQAVALSNDHIELIVLTGGGHIAAIRNAGGGVNALWEPHWPTVDPNLRSFIDTDVFGDSLEGRLLSSIAGHNLCIDVFGEQSPGECDAGLTFHGEAGMVVWSSAESGHDDGAAWFVLTTQLPNTCLEVERRYSLGDDARTVDVEETITNLVGFERAMGRSQHATLGADFLRGGALFSCNADRGHTWQKPHDEAATWAVDADFTYPDVPNADGSTSDWRHYPRVDSNSDLCTQRINPADAHGWFVAAQNAHHQAVVYNWERDAFPWLMTWEENYARTPIPWNCKELTRGMEFGSYAYATSRRHLVELGTLLDTPTYEWLDACETKITSFSISLFNYDNDLDEAPLLTDQGDALVAETTGWAIQV